MGWLAKFLFRIGYYPIEHQSVKNGFLQWYYQAACDEFVIGGLNANEAQLSRLALNAAQAAEKMDSQNPVIELLDTFEEYKKRMRSGLSHLVIFLFLIGAGTTGISVYTIDEVIIRQIGLIVGGILCIPVVLLSALYWVIEQQIRTNSELVAKFNRELVERPGNVRRNDRDWNRLAAQLFWNRSLSRPITINVLLLLSIIKVVRPGLYGTISGELHDQIRKFVNEDAKTIIKLELKRALHGEFGPSGTQSDPPPEPLPNSLQNEKFRD